MHNSTEFNQLQSAQSTQTAPPTHLSPAINQSVAVCQSGTRQHVSEFGSKKHNLPTNQPNLNHANHFPMDASHAT